MKWDKLILATKNRDKIQEISFLLQDLNITVLSYTNFANFPDVVEDLSTIQGNAIKKAKTISQFFNCPALADDTGLEVDVLAGAPGVFSSRYAGLNATYEDNVNKLLFELKNIPSVKKSARFRTAIALVIGNHIQTVEGVLEGFIIEEKKGTGGFGYDPIFYLPHLKKTLAELNLEEKNSISHRGQAISKIKKVIVDTFNGA